MTPGKGVIEFIVLLNVGRDQELSSTDKSQNERRQCIICTAICYGPTEEVASPNTSELTPGLADRGQQHHTASPDC